MKGVLLRSEAGPSTTPMVEQARPGEAKLASAEDMKRLAGEVKRAVAGRTPRNGWRSSRVTWLPLNPGSAR